MWLWLDRGIINMDPELKLLKNKIDFLLLEDKKHPASRNLSDENQQYTEIKTEFCSKCKKKKPVLPGNPSGPGIGSTLLM